MNPDNIVAIATANGVSGIGIIRISGQNLLPLAQKLIKKTIVLKPRVAHYSDFFDNDNDIIDSGLILYFKSPFSFTGEEVLELHGHGSPIALQMLVKRTIELGCRLASAGEFSKRAYLNNKIDLVQAESIIDLINAETEAAVKSSLKSLKGTFSKYIQESTKQLIDLRMFIEATLDFPEEDIEFIANAKIRQKLEDLQLNLKQIIANTKQGVLLNNGANIVIIGQPNVGKSSLLNALANEEIAIVTDIAGTTRDIIKEKIIINNIAFNLIDTAGIQETQDVVEKIGIERALSAINTAQLCLILIDDTQGITPTDWQILAKIPNSMPRLFVHNKIDMTNNIAKTEIIDNYLHIFISAKKHLGLDLLREAILNLVGFDSNNHNIFIARTRHLDALNRTMSHIDNGFMQWENLELLAEELRYAHNKLGEITGEYSADELLGEIFSKFCIGK